MTDRELLELAAKAADIDLYIDNLPSGWSEYTNRDTLKVWNPLTDDGDALRLAVKLDLLRQAEVSLFPQASDNELEATRRAIVRAAAEIGKSIP